VVVVVVVVGVVDVDVVVVFVLDVVEMVDVVTVVLVVSDVVVVVGTHSCGSWKERSRTSGLYPLFLLREFSAPVSPISAPAYFIGWL